MASALTKDTRKQNGRYAYFPLATTCPPKWNTTYGSPGSP
jgi:hypothetical protein